MPAMRSADALVVALDLSRSMDAADIAPSRIGRAKLKLLALLERRTAGQTALVVFSAHAFTVTPLTNDTRTIAALVGSLESDIMPSRGSYTEAGLTRAAQLLEQAGAPGGEILLMTDAKVSPRALDTARELRARGIRTHVLAFGTEEGAPISESDGGFVTDGSGSVVVARLDVPGLRSLARAGGGRFAIATPDQADLADLFPQPSGTGAAAVASEDAGFQTEVWRDEGRWLVLLLTPLLALAFRRGWVACLVLALAVPSGPANAFEWSDLWQRRDQQGYEAFNRGDANEASKLFDDPEWRAAAEYRAGEFAASASTLESAADAETLYNRGNALAKAGQLDAAIDVYQHALALDPQHEDARYNLELLEQAKQQQQQQQQQQAATRVRQRFRAQRARRGQRVAPGRRGFRVVVGARRERRLERFRRAAGASSVGRGFPLGRAAARGRRDRRGRSGRAPARRGAAAIAVGRSEHGTRARAGRGPRAERPRRPRAVGLRAGGRAMAAADSAGPRRLAAAEVSLSVPAHGRRPGRQLRVARRRGRAMVRPIVRAVLPWLVAAIAGSALAQGLQVTASVDRDSVRENESFTYTLRAEGAVRGDPNLQRLSQDFEILNRSRTSRIQIVNGQASQVAEWVVELMPRAAGHFTLPPIELGGARSNAVEVEVQPALAGGAARGDIFIEVEAEPSSVYAQSELVYTLRIFRAVSAGRATLTPPEVTGGEAIVEPLGDDREYQTTRGGRNYVVRERSFAIFPQVSGLYTVEPVTFETVVLAASGFSRVQRVRSDAVQFRAEPPVAPPDAYPNAGWLPAHSLKLTESWSEDPSHLTVGVPLTRTVKIEAEGLLETQLPELEPPAGDALKQYADQPELERHATPRGLEVSRTERFAVIGQSPGQVELPAVELPWWNVNAQRWEVARLPARTVQIAPSTERTARADTPAPSADADPSPPAAAGGDLRLWQGLSAGLAIAWLATLAFWLGGARRRRAREPEAGPSEVPAPRRAASRRLLRRAREACRANDPSETRKALLEWAAVRLGPEAPRSLGMLAAKLPAGIGAELERLEASLYGPERGPWEGKALAEALVRIDSVARSAEERVDDPLLPLYR